MPEIVLNQNGKQYRIQLSVDQSTKRNVERIVQEEWGLSSKDYSLTYTDFDGDQITAEVDEDFQVANITMIDTEEDKLVFKLSTQKQVQLKNQIRASPVQANEPKQEQLIQSVKDSEIVEQQQKIEAMEAEKAALLEKIKSDMERIKQEQIELEKQRENLMIIAENERIQKERAEKERAENERIEMEKVEFERKFAQERRKHQMQQLELEMQKLKQIEQENEIKRKEEDEVAQLIMLDIVQQRAEESQRIEELEDRLRVEEEKLKIEEEEARKRAEDEYLKFEEENRRKAEEDARLKAEEASRKKEEMAKKKAQQAAKKQAQQKAKKQAEALKKAQDEKKKAEKAEKAKKQKRENELAKLQQKKQEPKEKEQNQQILVSQNVKGATNLKKVEEKSPPSKKQDKGKAANELLTAQIVKQLIRSEVFNMIPEIREKLNAKEPQQKPVENQNGQISYCMKCKNSHLVVPFYYDPEERTYLCSECEKKDESNRTLLKIKNPNFINENCSVNLLILKNEQFKFSKAENPEKYLEEEKNLLAIQIKESYVKQVGEIRKAKKQEEKKKAELQKKNKLAKQKAEKVQKIEVEPKVEEPTDKSKAAASDMLVTQ